MPPFPLSPLFISPTILKGTYQLSAQWNGENQKNEGLELELKTANFRAHELSAVISPRSLGATVTES